MCHFLISSILMQPQSIVHPTIPDSPLFFPTIHERPMSFSPPPACPSPKVPAAQRRKSTSFLESQGRHSQPQMRTVGPSPFLPGGDAQGWNPDAMAMLGKQSLRAATETVHRHPLYETVVFVDGRTGIATPNEAQMRPVEAVFLANLPYNSQAEVYNSPAGSGHMDEQTLSQLGSVYDYQTGQTYIARPIQSLRLEPGVNQPSPLGSISAPAISDARIMFHQVFMPQSAPPILGQGSEGHPGCVFEFHVHTSSPGAGEGGVFLPHRVYRTRRGSMDTNPEEPSPGSVPQSRLQTVTEEQYNHLGSEPATSVTDTLKQCRPVGSPEYSSDSSQRNSSDPGDHLFSPPAVTAPSTDTSLTYTQNMYQDSQVFFCFTQPAAAAYPGSPAVYNQQVPREPSSIPAALHVF
ncbi:hypothetical protein FKM82_011729 [Ascaphus truei]